MSKSKKLKLNDALTRGIEAGIKGNDDIPNVSPQFTELIGKALVDQEFRKRLFTDQKSVLNDFDLTRDDLLSLEKINEETLKRHLEGIGGTAAWKIYVEISKSF